MIHSSSPVAIIIFLAFISVVLGISFYLGAKAKSSKGYFTAGGTIHWAVNGIAFAGDYLSAASFLGICGMIAFFGYDGFLYSIGYLAGWIVALFIIAEPLKRLGRYTFADALDNKFNSRSIKLTAAISTLVVSIFYLIPQMVGAGALVQPLLGFPHYVGVIIVGLVVITIVVTAGMVSTTWVQFIKGSLLVCLCFVITIMILNRGISTEPKKSDGTPVKIFKHDLSSAEVIPLPGDAQRELIPPSEGWVDKPYVRILDKTSGEVSVWRKEEGDKYFETQTMVAYKDGRKMANGKPHGKGEGQGDLSPVGYAYALPGGVKETGPLGPLSFIQTMQSSNVILWGSDKIMEQDGTATTVYYQRPSPGSDFMTPGSSPTFKKVRSKKLTDKLDFLSLMLALFCGTASLPHILIRYYTVKDQISARKSTVVGIAAIGFFYVLTLFLGLGAMTSGTMDVSDSNMAAPLLARSFNELLFSIISAVAFTTVLGTVSGLIMAASGAVAHDIMSNYLKIDMDDFQKVRSAKFASIAVGLLAIILGILFAKMNVNFLVGWAFNIAASSNLPALVMLLFWSKTTKEGISSAILVGMLSSLSWILLSAQAYKDVYGIDPAMAIVPFSQPAIVTIPLGFLVLIVVSLFTQKKPQTI
ncbi:MAG: cation acetate symporter [Bdellovibrionales bacterium RIFOXYD12_FULL_39_22]|nr:MAG: cation acetate symporter [Bdellovibrionales bacterium RIFOXYB1_FULL_39_21]OFZ43967.1 MAG: cation acetate symporter [Bdellovibrionales bacterium RIFOXYC12_FULL_39_17]OFZ48339.1 MAG: cation acetate symporter [Bdellovibrionales bacterium RIFOXYC1_FULL_39_130]OFZ76644.1 MAG: cation acetate symporter [Bdellovibrionales bacterium RIFOXYD1_FULL_39_84]OFZ94930.1 MAG: cation acetate symporter [Bdellovibrionales bacterium RIFOXYD12_FULL_39_22]HLE12648.1 cation acetate symporter [Bacteriovoracace